MAKTKLIISLLLLFSALLWIRFGLYSFLSPEKPIKCRTAIVEEWLPAYALEDMAAAGALDGFDTLIIPGSLRTIETYKFRQAQQAAKFTLHHASALVFDSLQATDTLTLRLSGTPANGWYPHCSVWQGDSLTNSFFVGGEDKDYVLVFTEIKNQPVRILFDNDTWQPEGDRNIRVRYVKRNSTFLKYEAAAPVAVRLPAICARYLSDLGVTPPRTITITRMRIPVNKTAHSAMLVNNFYGVQGQHPGQLMVYSLAYHSRRTYKAYQRALPEIKLGVHPLPNRLYTPENWYKSTAGIYRMVDEAASLVVTGVHPRLKGFKKIGG